MSGGRGLGEFGAAGDDHDEWENESPPNLASARPSAPYSPSGYSGLARRQGVSQHGTQPLLAPKLGTTVLGSIAGGLADCS